MLSSLVSRPSAAAALLPLAAPAASYYGPSRSCLQQPPGSRGFRFGFGWRSAVRSRAKANRGGGGERWRGRALRPPRWKSEHDGRIERRTGLDWTGLDRTGRTRGRVGAELVQAGAASAAAAKTWQRIAHRKPCNGWLAAVGPADTDRFVCYLLHPSSQTRFLCRNAIAIQFEQYTLHLWLLPQLIWKPMRLRDTTILGTIRYSLKKTNKINK